MDEATENAVTAFAIDFPAYGQVRVSNELRKKGIFVSPTGVRYIWLRHGLDYETSFSCHGEEISRGRDILDRSSGIGS